MKKNNLPLLRKMDRKIRWLFIFSTVAFVCFMVILYQQTSSQGATRQGVYNSYFAIKKLEKVNTLVVETESATRGYLLTGDAAWKKTLQQSHTQLITTLTEIRHVTSSGSHNKKKFEALDSLANAKVLYQDELVNSSRVTPGLLEKIRSDGQARQITRSIKSLLAVMIQDEEKILSEQIAKNEKDYTTGVFFAVFGCIFAFILVIAVLVQLNSDIILRKKAEEEVSISESKYRSLIENAGVVVFTADMNGNVTFTNNMVYELTGYTADELMGNHFGVLIDPSWIGRVADFYRVQFQEKVPATTLDFLTRTKSGEEKWVEQFAQLLYKDGRIVGFQCIVKDITGKKKIELQLNESELKRKENEYRLTAILDNTTTLIFIKDLQGRYIMVNKRFKDVFGLTDEMVLNKTDHDFNDRERADHYKKLDDEVISRLLPIESEELVDTSNGKRNLLLVKFPLLDDRQHVFGISGIATDITERVQSRQELEEALMNAREAKELQEQFLANMSHEIRTPLNGIQGMTSLLLETELSGEQKEFTNMIKRSLNNLVTIVNDVLDFSNIKAGKLTIDKIEFSLPETIEVVKDQFSHQVTEKGLDLKVRVENDVPDLLIGDPYRLRQVLVSLLGNAIKFTNNGSVKIQVTVMTRTDVHVSVLFTITDTGIGIPDDKLDTIFESFAQADMDISRGYGGAGLGLAISKGLVEIQGGEISVSSIPAEGSVFRFSVPYGLMKNAGNTPGPDHSLGLRGKRFLVVEDNEVNQKLIGLVLTKVGSLVDIASHGKEAQEYFEQGRQYDLVIMDLQMPVMDGYRTATYIRQELKLDIPIIAMTATALRGDQEKCRQVGMNDFMLKPFDFNDLYKRLDNLLNNKNEVITGNEKQAAPANRLYDLSLLEELDDKESLLDVITLFLDNTPQEIAALPALAEQKNWPMLYKQAHKIKGAVAILQATPITTLLGKIEALAKEEKNIPEIEAHIKEVLPLFAEMELKLREEREQIQKEVSAAG